MFQCLRLRAVSISLLAGLAFGAHAGDLPIAKYDEAKDSQLFQAYVLGIESGLSWANVDLLTAGKAPLYCQPMHMGMTKEQILEVLGEGVGSIRKDPKFLAQSPDIQATFSVTLALKRALQNRYPCAVTSSTPVQQPVSVIQPAPVYQPAPLPAAPAVTFPSAPGRTTTICRTLSNGTIVCD